MAFGTYSEVEPLDNANGLVNKDNLYQVTIDPNVTLNGGAIPVGAGVRTVVRQGTRVLLQRNPTKDGYEILELNEAGSATGNENACLITEINFLGDGAAYSVLDRQGNQLDVMTIATSLIICADEAGDFYLV